MKDGLISIMDSEEAYAVRLAEYFRHKSGLGCNVQIFTDIYSFIEFDRNNYSDILILSDVYGNFISEFINVGQIYILSEGSIDVKLSSYSTIYKYQSTDNIIRDVMTSYSAIPSPGIRVSIKNACSDIISVYSPVKRCGKTTFALVMGALLAMKETALYISLEEFSCVSFFAQSRHTGDLSDLLYFYRQNPENLDKKLLSVSYPLQKLDIVPPMRFSMDLKCMSGNDWCEFFCSIANLGRYQNIIVDVSDCAVDTLDILSVSTKVYFPVLEDSLSAEKVKYFKNFVSSLGRGDILEKCRELTLPLPDRDFLGDDAFANLLYGEYGAAVAQLIKNE